MNKDLNIFSFWAIDTLDDADICKKQLHGIKSLGFDGVIFHPRRFTGKVEYLSGEYMKILSELIIYAKGLNLDFWLYDENGWPSGSAGGAVEKSLPDLKREWLVYIDGKVYIEEDNGINSLDRRGVERFIGITHEAYKRELDSEAFDHIGGFFSDEVGFLGGHGACMDKGGIPWCDDFAKEYEERFDENIWVRLPEMFSEKESEFKIWYWETLTKRLADSFYKPINDWCESNGKLYTAHLKGEENPFFQIGYSGSCFQVLKKIGVPGVDALERYPGNEFYPRIASSVSKQFGSGIAMAEAMGGAGWGVTPADVERYMMWLADCGINMIVFHINQLHLSYDGITDWPASIPCHEPWREVFPELIKKLKNKSRIIAEADTLVICPTRGVMNVFLPGLVRGMNEHDGSHQAVSDASRISSRIVDVCEKLSEYGIAFDVTDERVFEDNGIKQGDILKLGGCSYKYVIRTDGCIFTEKGEQLLKHAYVLTAEERISGKSCSQTAWHYRPGGDNRYFIETKNGTGHIYAEYICAFTLLISDKCSAVEFNGKTLVCVKNDDYGYYYRVPSELVKKGDNKLRIAGTDNIFAYAIGSFAVKNKYPFYEFDNRQLCAENGFYIAETGEINNDFIISGYPFSTEPMLCEKRLTGDISGYIKIPCNHIAAARVYINGKYVGWVYGGNEYIKLDKAYETLTVSCEVYQSAFNVYGPHHHREGDRRVVSPAQYSGEKNFADTPSLPDYTHERDMKFVKWSMAENIEITEEIK